MNLQSVEREHVRSAEYDSDRSLPLMGGMARLSVRDTHLYILYLVEKPWRFFSTKSMYSGEWWKGPLSDRSQSSGPPGLSLGRPLVVAAGPEPTTAQRKHTQQCRLRLTRPHRAIRDERGGGDVGAWRSAAELARHWLAPPLAGPGLLHHLAWAARFT